VEPQNFILIEINQIWIIIWFIRALEVFCKLLLTLGGPIVFVNGYLINEKVNFSTKWNPQTIFSMGKPKFGGRIIVLQGLNNVFNGGSFPIQSETPKIIFIYLFSMDKTEIGKHGMVLNNDMLLTFGGPIFCNSISSMRGSCSLQNVTPPKFMLMGRKLTSKVHNDSPTP
jgi:hypothetical protein